MPSPISLEVFYPYSIEEVWEAITDPEAISQWIEMKTDFKPKLGHKFRFWVDNPPKGWRGYVDSEVLEVQKPHRLSYTFNADEKSKNHVLTFVLTEEKGGTLLSFEHKGFEGVWGFCMKYFLMGPGWKSKVFPKYLPMVLKHMREKGNKFPKENMFAKK